MADLTRTAANVNDCMPSKSDVIPVKAAVAIAQGQALYQKSDGEWDLADASAAGTAGFRGVALQAKGAGEFVDLLIDGEVTGWDLSGVNYDAPVYLSDTAGELADAAGTKTVLVGRVVPISDRDLTKAIRLRGSVNWSEVIA